MSEEIKEINHFKKMNLSEEILRALDRKGFVQATSVQVQAIPPMMEKKDIIAKAPTGTGKTFAFGIPIIEHIDTQDERIQALILVPTRELSIQICGELRSICTYKHGIKVLSIYGGQSIDNQISMLKKRPNIIVATPGRLLDHINRRTIRLDAVRTVILDEADRMVDMGFYKDATRILDMTDKRENLGMFSATLSTDVLNISWKYQRDAVEITVFEDVENKPDINQFLIKTNHRDKPDEIMKIMKKGNYNRMIVFCNTKHQVDRVTRYIKERGCLADCIHGDIRQSARERVMDKFKRGGFSVLVATDVAARGLDVDNVDAVINYDIPSENEAYIHRIGRTGRAKKSGSAYILMSGFADSVRVDEIARHTNSSMEAI
ncbi:MAG: DEAD/DEAH box helicase [Clostridia bacterium]